jgi:hypothetical protein
MMNSQLSPTNTIQDQLQLEVAQYLLLDRGLDICLVPSSFMAGDSLVQLRLGLLASQFQNWPIPHITPPKTLPPTSDHHQMFPEQSRIVYMLMLDFCKLNAKYCSFVIVVMKKM